MPLAPSQHLSTNQFHQSAATYRAQAAFSLSAPYSSTMCPLQYPRAIGFDVVDGGKDLCSCCTPSNTLQWHVWWFPSTGSGERESQLILLRCSFKVGRMKKGSTAEERGSGQHSRCSHKFDRTDCFRISFAQPTSPHLSSRPHHPPTYHTGYPFGAFT